MAYDFDQVIDRRGTSCVKWDITKEGELPMWVADMDFQVAPAIKKALVERAEHGVFGYDIIPREYRNAIANWWQHRHQTEVNPNRLVFVSGVVAAMSSVVRALTNVGECVVVQPPVYNCFYSSIVDNGRRVLESPLVYEDGRYRIDFEDLENKLSQPHATLFALCNPHNPTGNIWSEAELARIGELCAKHQVAVFSDEIHCEITRPGMMHVPFARVNDTCRRISVTAASPSKAFNIAGLQSAYVWADDPLLRARVERSIHVDGVGGANNFACASTVAAYEECEDWLDELREYIQGNKDEVARFVASRVPGVRVCESDATYLLWLDCSGLADDADELQEFLRERTGLFVSKGSMYGESGRRFLRMNVAAPRALVEDGLARLQRGCEAFAAR